VTSVFVADGHEVVRRGFASLLVNEPDLRLVGEAGTAADAVALVLRLRPDVIIVEAQLPDGDGVALYKALRADCPGLKCLLFTGAADHTVIYAAILGGIDGIVSKRSSGMDLVAALREVAAGHAALDPAFTGALTDRLRGAEDAIDRLARLTPKQRTIVNLIAQGKTNREIAEALGIAEKTVKNYVSHLLSKMGFSRRTEIAVYMARLPEHHDSDVADPLRIMG